MHNLKLRHVKTFGACVCVHVRVLMGRGCKHLLCRSAMSPWMADSRGLHVWLSALFRCLTQRLYLQVNLGADCWLKE